MYLIFDVETTGLCPHELAPEYTDSYPQIVQIAWCLVGLGTQDVSIKSHYINPTKRISPKAASVHKLTKEYLKRHGTDPKKVLQEFLDDAASADVIISHNIKFDFPVLESELFRLGFGRPLKKSTLWCTMLAGKKYMSERKWPKLIELAEFCNVVSDNAIDIPTESKLHNAVTDVDLALQCFVYLMGREPSVFKKIKIKYEKIQPVKEYTEPNVLSEESPYIPQETPDIPRNLYINYTKNTRDNGTKPTKDIFTVIKESEAKLKAEASGCSIIIFCIIVPLIVFAACS